MAGYTFDAKSVKRIRKSVQETERNAYRESARRSPRHNKTFQLTAIVGTASSAIDAATIASGDITPGSGTVNVYQVKSTDPLVLEDSTVDITAYNYSSAVVSADRTVMCKKAFGYWFIDFESCEALAST